jgi:hypothetical protein
MYGMSTRVIRLRNVAAIVCLITVVACQTRDFERRFFKQPLETRVERSRQLSLEEQYKVFRYGNDVVHPPLMDLADPIAERGRAAVAFLLSQLDGDHRDTATRDILLVFERMAFLKSYDVKADQVVMKTLSARVANMRDRQWQPTCQKMLQRIRNL